MCFSKAAPPGASDSKAWRFTRKHRHAWHLRQAQVGWERSDIVWQHVGDDVGWLERGEWRVVILPLQRLQSPLALLIHWLNGHERPKVQPCFSRTAAGIVYLEFHVQNVWNRVQPRSVLWDKSLKGSQLIKFIKQRSSLKLKGSFFESSHDFNLFIPVAAAVQVGRHLATPGSCCRGLCLRSLRVWRDLRAGWKHENPQSAVLQRSTESLYVSMSHHCPTHQGLFSVKDRTPSMWKDKICDIHW